jgi:hypothetical protein
LQYACICNIQIYFYNIHLKHMKYLEHTLELYVYNHYNMCNIPIYFCNIDIQDLQIPLKHLKYLKHTLVTCGFHPSSSVRCNT